MKKFRSLSSYTAGGRQMFCVLNPCQCRNFQHLIGSDVEIDDQQWRITGVEHYAKLPPFREGERIGLAVVAANR